MKRYPSQVQRISAARQARLLSLLMVLFSVAIATFLALTLVAMAHAQTLSSGGSGRELTLHYPQIEAAQFPRIVSYVTAVDSTGATIGGLTQDQFVVREDSTRELPILVEEITNSSEGISVVLAMDRSGSIEEELADAKSAATAFVNLMGAKDQAALVSFASDVRTNQTFTQERTLLTTAIQGLVAKGGTAIYDAALVCADLLQSVSGRKAIILMTDGLDKDSQTTLEQAVQRFAGAGIPIFAIGLGAEVSETNLRMLAESSGGRYYFSPTSKQLEEIYRAIATLLHHSYRITYNTHNPTTDGSLRKVRIDVNSKAAAAFAYNSYRAPNHVPTIAPTTQSLLTPAQDFQVQIEIPAASKYMYNLFDLQFVLTYDQRYLRIKSPFNANVLPQAFFGTAAEFTFAATVDSALGQISFRLKRKTGLAPVEGRGPLAQIKFHAGVNLPDSARLTFNLINLAARDKNNWPVAVQPENLTVQSSGLLVWPGDTNQNGVVELTDVTTLGLHWEVAGPKRPGTENQTAWMPHVAKKFLNVKATHADANGSGKIDERDLFPIGLNWRKSTTSGNAPKTFAPSQNAPHGSIGLALMPLAQTRQYRLAVVFQNATHEALAGLSFRLKYRGAALRILAAEATPAWGSTPLVMKNDDHTTGTFAMSLMIPAESASIASTGALVHLLVLAERELQAGELELCEVAVLSPSGELRELQAAQEELHGAAPQEFALHPAYPNPFRGRAAATPNTGTTLRYDLPEAAQVEITVFNLAGQRVQALQKGLLAPGKYSAQWQGGGEAGAALSSGVYVIKLAANGASGRAYRATQKITLVK